MQGPNTMNSCPRCAHDNSADVHLCGDCGLRLDGLCPACHTQNDHSARFCGNCRHDFAANPGERHQPSSGDLRDEHHSSPYAERTSSIPPGIDCPRCMHTNVPGALFCDNCGLIFANVQPRRRQSRTVAGFAVGKLWQRFGGFMIDGLIIFALLMVVAPITINESLSDIRGSIEEGTQSQRMTVLDSILTVTYETLLVAAITTTIGKRVFGLAVIRADGSKVTFKRALVRAGVKALTISLLPGVLPLILIFANVIMVAARSDKRAIHDLIAGTAVIQLRK
jgi:uncharacterized RDD family membrane protein YckC